MTNLAVVLPVHNHAALLEPCLASVVPQAEEFGAKVIVVDDGSTDDTAERARRLGAVVLRHDEPMGPYAARNRGWRSTDAAVLVFTDVRCRARPGWLAGLVAALSSMPEAAVVGGDTHTLAGPGPARAFAHRRQALLAGPALAHEFLPYLPTCNIATRRAVLEAVGGFTEIHSGGDVDFSWRVQLAGLGEVTFAPGADMDWEPRATTREIIRQYKKYGAAWPPQAQRFGADGFVPMPPSRSLARLVVSQARVLADDIRQHHGRGLAVDLVERACWFAYRDAYRRTWREMALPDLDPSTAE